METTDIVMALMLALIVFMLMKNLVARNEMKKIAAQSAVVVHHDTRKWVKIARILCALFAVVFTVIMIVNAISLKITFLIDYFFGVIVSIVALLFFAITPYDTWEWVITDKGIYIYNIGHMIPWSQIITTGIQKSIHFRVVLQLKKAKGEMFKNPYQVIGAESEEKANEYSKLIREFIHALDKMRMYRQQKEERKVEKSKRNWF